MNFKEVLTKLYFILIYSDGKVNEKEVSYGRKMILAEGIDEEYFLSQIKLLEVSNHQQNLLPEAISGLKKLSKEEQIRCIAWLCVIANSDGFMDKSEWQMIYRLYHKELQLPLDVIMKAQKNLAASATRNPLSNLTGNVLI